MSEGEAPLERKNWNFGRIKLWVSEERSHGSLMKMLRMLESEKPWFLKKVKTELGFSGELKRSRFDALRAVSRGKPMVLMR